MKKKKLIRLVAGIAITGALIGGGAAIYMFNMPHRDVLAAKADYSLTNSQIVTEYLRDTQAADNKYLADDGDSKILEVTGTVKKISENFNAQKVVLLKEEGDNAGVSATFTQETNHKVSYLKIGDVATIKGVIRSGAAFDEDLGFYENVILEKSDIIIK
jgi:ABC-type taurine transport system substrate-binding protein